MAVWHRDSKRKPTGGLRSRARKSRNFQKGRETMKTVIGDALRKKSVGAGGNTKVVLRATDTANVTGKGLKKAKKVKILRVLENPANPQLVKQGVITKGAIIETEAGKARVTSRPGQDGVLNALLLE